MQEMRSGTPLIPPGTNAKRTLILLNALCGPLPKKLVAYADKKNFPIIKKWSLTMSRSSSLNIPQMRQSESNIEAEYNECLKRAREIRDILSDPDGEEFRDLVLDNALVLDPDKRITAREALAHRYFQIEIRAPVTP